jgi:hypothetical protein
MTILKPIGVICVVGLIAMLILLCIPMSNVPLPRSLRQNATLRKFFCWDEMEHFETNFDETALTAYLDFRKKHEQEEKR